MTALLLLVAVAALATPAAPATAGPGPAGTLSLAANSTVRQLDEALVWWQTRALDTADMLPRSVFEDVLQRHHQQQQQTQATVENRRTIAGTMAMAAEMGYTAENHTVRTSDGYLLTLFRLPNPGKPAVFIAHGLLGSSADFLVQGRGRALAPLLHDGGFDVWLFNARGTTPSKKHENMEHHPWHSRFWDFSWHDIGYSDIPASIDVVLKTTGQSQVHYVGFCQGSTSFFVLGSERSDYLDKIKTFVGLAPVAFVRDVRSFPVRLFSLAPSKVLFLMKLFGVNEFLPNNKLISLLGDMLCTDGEVFPPVCSSVLFLMFGTDTELMNTTILPTFFANSPAGASTKQLLHYGQLVNHKHQTFRQFDYGRIGNLKKYGQPKPPDYNLTRLNVPSYLFYSDNDNICVQSNIDELSRRLPNIPEGGIRKVMNSKFNHLDYILARNAKELVYDSVIEILRKNDAMSNTQSSAGTTSTNPATAPTPLTSTPSTTTPTTTPVTTAPTPVVSSTSNPVSSYTSNTIPSIPASSTTSSPVSTSTVNPISISTASPATTSADNYANPNNPIISASTGNPIPSWSSFTTSTASPTTSARSESPPSPAWPAWPIGSGSSSSSPATPPELRRRRRSYLIGAGADVWRSPALDLGSDSRLHLEEAVT